MRRVSPTKADRRAKRDVYGPLCEAARNEGRCRLCDTLEPCTPHHPYRTGAGWSDWIHVITHPLHPVVAVCANPVDAAALVRDSDDPAGCVIERRGNVCPVCAFCHHRCHNEAGFEDRDETSKLAAEFGVLFRKGAST